MDFEKYFIKTYKDIIDSYMYKKINRDNIETSITSIRIENNSELTMYVYATICIDYYLYQDVEESSWFTVKCFVDLECSSNFKVLEIVDREKPVMKKYSINSKTLVPYICIDEYDDIANEILRKYYSKEELIEYIDPTELAKRMGLLVEYRNISNDNSIFGISCFKDSIIKTYENMEEKEEFFSAGTIIVDRDTFSGCDGFYSVRFTIAHECVHWYLHRKFMLLNNDLLDNLSCTEEGIIGNAVFNDIFKIMEYQANGIAARILLPNFKFKNDFNLLFDSLVLRVGKLKAYEEGIKMISDRIKISKEAIKIRLMELGYNVDGICQFIDEKYSKSYLHNNNLREDESSSISTFEILRLLFINERFSSFLRENNFIYVDNHLCVNNQKYIDNNHNLTEYALNNINECCVLFKYEIKDNNKLFKPSKCTMFRANSKGRDFYIKDFVPHDKLLKDRNGLALEEQKKIDELIDRIRNKNIQDALRECREARNISQNDLGIISNYSERTIREIETKENRQVTKENILRIALGLNLAKDVIYYLIEIGGFSLNNNLQENVVYRLIIDSMPGVSISEIDTMLISNGQKPLFEKEK